MLRLLPSLLAVSLSVCVLTGGAALLFFGRNGLSSDKKRYSIALVGDVDNPYIEFGLKTLKALDDTEFIIDLKLCSEKEARSLLRNKQIAAYVVIPEGFIQAVERGENTERVTYVTQLGQRGIVDMLKDQIAGIVSTLIIHAQSGIFAMESLVYGTPEQYNIQKYNIELNVKYLDWAFNRTDFCTVTEKGFSDGMSYNLYYSVGIMLMFLLLSGLTFSTFFTRRNNALCKIIKAHGLGALRQVLAEYIVYLLLALVSIAVLCGLFGILISTGKFSLSEWDYLSAGRQIFKMFSILVPAAIMISAMQFLFFELTSSVISASVIQFTIILVSAYLGGYFYPLSFFPEKMQALCGLLPATVALDFSRNLAMDDYNHWLSLGIAIYSLAFFGVAVLVRASKLEHKLGRLR